jgi:hypothetical protein
LSCHRGRLNESDTIRWSMDIHYQDASKPTGHAYHPGFLVRSRANPSGVLRDHATWNALLAGRDSEERGQEALAVAEPDWECRRLDWTTTGPSLVSLLLRARSPGVNGTMNSSCTSRSCGAPPMGTNGTEDALRRYLAFVHEFPERPAGRENLPRLSWVCLSHESTTLRAPPA